MTTPTHTRPYILLTNDDGIAAPGLHALADALAPHAELMIVAPHEERSGAGHAITFLRDLQCHEYPRDGCACWGYSLTGTPADCVKVAVTHLSRERPFDLVVSGINRGVNAGINVLYSGTVAAAREATLLGLPAIAMSLLYRDEHHLPWETAARVAVDVFGRVRERGLPPGVMLNVNVPPVAYDELQGWAVTRMGDAAYTDRFLHQPGEDAGPAIYRNVGDKWNLSRVVADDVDDRVLEANRVSISPLHFDLTAYSFLPQLKLWFNGHVQA